MKAIQFDAPGGPDVLYIGEYEAPQPGPGQVLVHIAATALNRADLIQRRGKYPVPAGQSPLLGLEMAGTVIETGTDVTDFEIGDNVCALMNGGGYAQLAVVDQEMLLRLPGNLSFTKAAAIPEVFLTAYQALHFIADLQKGEQVLIHAGGSGVGTAAIQLCRLAGATPIVTASGGKHERLKEIGAAHCIDYKKENFAERVKEITDGQGVNVLLDFVGGSYFAQNLDALALEGRMVCLGFLGGFNVAALNLAPILRKRLRIEGTTLRARSQAYKYELTAGFRRDCWPAFVDRKLRAVVDTIYDWEEVDDAHRYMESNANLGKIVLTIGE
ncbi:NADPH:quinone oxidoreductase [Lewinellaceae bacterium SD302]|nr:NADPH:quinone oxidoreductase [Lewinellaceae bacterium SD302]